MRLSYLFLSLVLLSSCEFRQKSEPVNEPVPTASRTTSAEEPSVPAAVPPVTGAEAMAGQAVAQPANEDLKLDDSPIGVEYAAIWELSDPYPALKEFSEKYGLFLETSEKVGEMSVLGNEGPCGEDYVSLVKDTSKVIEHAWEIDAKGKILREWRTGSNEILRVEKNRLFRVIDLVRKPSDFNLTNPKRDASFSSFVLAIEPNGKFELLSDDAETAKKWKVTEERCPKGLKIESDYKYCVREKATKRLFVLQRECT